MTLPCAALADNRFPRLTGDFRSLHFLPESHFCEKASSELIKGLDEPTEAATAQERAHKEEKGLRPRGVYRTAQGRGGGEAESASHRGKPHKSRETSCFPSVLRLHRPFVLQLSVKRPATDSWES